MRIIYFIKNKWNDFNKRHLVWIIPAIIITIILIYNFIYFISNLDNKKSILSSILFVISLFELIPLGAFLIIWPIYKGVEKIKDWIEKGNEKTVFKTKGKNYLSIPTKTLNHCLNNSDNKKIKEIQNKITNDILNSKNGYITLNEDTDDKLMSIIITNKDKFICKYQHLKEWDISLTDKYKQKVSLKKLTDKVKENQNGTL